MYSSFTPSNEIATCQLWRKAFSSAVDIGIFHSFSLECTKVPRLWKVTRMSPLLIGIVSVAPDFHCGNCGRR